MKSIFILTHCRWSTKGIGDMGDWVEVASDEDCTNYPAFATIQDAEKFRDIIDGSHLDITEMRIHEVLRSDSK